MKFSEYGLVNEIFYDAWHPYTWALLSSLPQLGIKGEPLPTIEGTPPNLFNTIKGDAFAPRNKQALAIDFEEEPPFFEITETHQAKTTIEGTPPNLFNTIKGDAFAPRNKQALAIDFEEEPPFFEITETHQAKTWYLDPRAPKIEQPKAIKMLRQKMQERG